MEDNSKEKILEKYKALMELAESQNSSTALTAYSFCPSCGRKLESGWSFCPSCGRSAHQFEPPYIVPIYPVHPWYPTYPAHPWYVPMGPTTSPWPIIY